MQGRLVFEWTGARAPRVRMRELAGQLAESAEHLRQLAEQGAALVDPILTYGARISDVADSWVDLLRVRPEGVPGDGLGDNE